MKSALSFPYLSLFPLLPMSNPNNPELNSKASANDNEKAATPVFSPLAECSPDDIHQLQPDAEPISPPEILADNMNSNRNDGERKTACPPSKNSRKTAREPNSWPDFPPS